MNQAPCASPGITRVAEAACGSTEPCQVWATAPFCDGYSYIALLNGGDSAATFALDFDVLPGRAADTSAAVRDLWGHRELGVYTGTLPAAEVVLAPHATMALQLRPQS